MKTYQQLIFLDNLKKTQQGQGSAVTKIINSVGTILAFFQKEERFNIMLYRLYVLKSGISRQLKLNILSLTEEKKEIDTGIYRAKEIDLSIQECSLKSRQYH